MDIVFIFMAAAAFFAFVAYLVERRRVANLRRKYDPVAPRSYQQKQLDQNERKKRQI